MTSSERAVLELCDSGRKPGTNVSQNTLVQK